MWYVLEAQVTVSFSWVVRKHVRKNIHDSIWTGAVQRKWNGAASWEDDTPSASSVKIFQYRQPKIQRIVTLMIDYPLKSSCVCSYLLCCFAVADRFPLVSAFLCGAWIEPISFIYLERKKWTDKWKHSWGGEKPACRTASATNETFGLRLSLKLSGFLLSFVFVIEEVLDYFRDHKHKKPTIAK